MYKLYLIACIAISLSSAAYAITPECIGGKLNKADKCQTKTHVFNIIDASSPVSSSNDCPNFASSAEVRYPQIEKPSNAHEELWNKVIKEQALDLISEPEECTQFWQEYKVTYSSKNLISTSSESDTYAFGTPHPYSSQDSVLWNLIRDKKIEAEDLFDRKTKWQNQLTKTVIKKLKTYEKQNGLSFHYDPKTIQNIITDPTYWIIKENGLDIQFSEFNLGSDNVPLIEVKWAILKKYLAPPLAHELAF